MEQTFEQVLFNFAKYIEEVTGMDATGDQVGRGRFPSFRLTDGIKEKIGRAIDKFEHGQSEAEVIADLQHARDHFNGQQRAFLRAHALPDLSRSITALRGLVSNDFLDPISKCMGMLEEYCRQIDVDLDLDKASTDYWAIIDMVESAQAEHEKRLSAEREVKREQERQIIERRKKERQSLARKLKDFKLRNSTTLIFFTHHKYPQITAIEHKS